MVCKLTVGNIRQLYSCCLLCLTWSTRKLVLPPALREYCGARSGSYCRVKLIKVLFGLLLFRSTWSSKVISPGISPSHLRVLPFPSVLHFLVSHLCGGKISVLFTLHSSMSTFVRTKRTHRLDRQSKEEEHDYASDSHMILSKKCYYHACEWGELGQYCPEVIVLHWFCFIKKCKWLYIIPDYNSSSLYVGLRTFFIFLYLGYHLSFLPISSSNWIVFSLSLDVSRCVAERKYTQEQARKEFQQVFIPECNDDGTYSQVENFSFHILHGWQVRILQRMKKRQM